MQGFLEESGLKIAKLIKSGSGFGIVLTGGLEGLHPEIRAYVTNNNEMIRQLVKNYTKPTVVSFFHFIHISTNANFIPNDVRGGGEGGEGRESALGNCP